MAKDPKGSTTQKGNDSGVMGLVMGLAILTLVSGGGGFFFAQTFLAAPTQDQKAQKAPATAGSAKGEGHGEHGAAEAAAEPSPLGDLIPLPPVITNLAEPREVFVRVEGSIMVEPGYSDAKVLAAKVSEDMVALLRTVSLAQIEGASGLAHLREDLNDRVRIRSEGKARELILNTLVVE